MDLRNECEGESSGQGQRERVLEWEEATGGKQTEQTEQCMLGRAAERPGEARVSVLND